MTPRFFLIFAALLVAMLLGEWLQFFRGFDTHLWTFLHWLAFAGIVLAEAIAVAIITVTVDRALPTAGNRALTRSVKQSRRGSQKYPAR